VSLKSVIGQKQITRDNHNYDVMFLSIR